MRVIWEADQFHSFVFPDVLAAFSSCELSLHSHNLLLTFLHGHTTWVGLLTPSWLQLSTGVTLSSLRSSCGALVSLLAHQDSVWEAPLLRWLGRLRFRVFRAPRCYCPWSCFLCCVASKRPKPLDFSICRTLNSVVWGERAWKAACFSQQCVSTLEHLTGAAIAHGMGGAPGMGSSEMGG